jgi:hypothetical protein
VLLCLLLALLVSISPPANARQGRFYTAEEFLTAYLAPEHGSPQTLWLTAELRRQAEAVLGHRFPPLRLRYWQIGSKSAWILEEIGKEMPITLGVVVGGDHIDHLVVLEYRESRGGEITYPFFTQQFQERKLAEAGEPKLEGHIDGITGATLSVRAATRVATLALLLHRQVLAGEARAGSAVDGTSQQ